MKIEGIGEVIVILPLSKMESQPIRCPIIFHFQQHQQKREMSCKAFLSLQKVRKIFKIKNKLSKILSTVLQLPEHRIVIAEMKKRGKTMKTNKRTVWFLTLLSLVAVISIYYIKEKHQCPLMESIFSRTREVHTADRKSGEQIKQNLSLQKQYLFEEMRMEVRMNGAN